MENLYKKTIFSCTHPRYNLTSGVVPYWVVNKNKCMTMPCPLSHKQKCHPEVRISPTSYMFFENDMKKFKKWVSSLHNKKIEFTAEIDDIRPVFEMIEVKQRARRGLKAGGMNIRIKMPLIAGEIFHGAANIILEEEKQNFSRGDTILCEGRAYFQETGIFFVYDVSDIRVVLPCDGKVCDESRSFAPPRNVLKYINPLAENMCEDCKFSVLVKSEHRSSVFGKKKQLYTLFCQSSHCVMGMEGIFEKDSPLSRTGTVAEEIGI